MCGFITQLVEHRTGIAEVTGSNPVEALIFFFRLLLSNCLNWKIYCDDHSSLSNTNISKQMISFMTIDLWQDLPYKFKDLNQFAFPKSVKNYILSQQYQT